MKSGWIVKVLLFLVFVALVANIVVAGVRKEGGYIDEDLVKLLAYGVLVAANLFIAGSGAYFTMRTRQKSEKSSALWGLRAFAVNLIATVVLALAPFFSSSANRIEHIFAVSMVLLLFGLSNAAFLYAFYRDYLRTVGSRRSRSRRSARSRRGRA